MDLVAVVLVLEDDELVQSIVEEMLSEGGFKTDMVASGEEAVSLLNEHKGKYRALVTDIKVRGKMDGWE
jgi:CheY-like chemotaxis protein